MHVSKPLHGTLFAALAMFASISCVDIQSDEDLEQQAPNADTDVDSLDTGTTFGEQQFRGSCTAECADGSLVSTSCDSQCTISDQVCSDSASGYVQCEGETAVQCSSDACEDSCPTAGCDASCYFNGTEYAHGTMHSLGATCSAKLDGYCIGGAWPGYDCIASGQCYATCDNGEWVH
ncbi:hypothetical protein G6O69_08220 [Pseudenhygromyxa sp. WMMC2535]|uniref:hypothetical protein n=1 Tax=Pseudenhygromyxa sp. WMMC2535 TaxID=2712867 RepID=UPI0015537EEA|nr:hypothetical protein [Pseudenhygromyxa sp. WMMC2535]NVB37816.1 hypothetical protein [Pseudenhygromyxa sp. WMMC2535]